jgi:hypothetical protein
MAETRPRAERANPLLSYQEEPRPHRVSGAPCLQRTLTISLAAR